MVTPEVFKVSKYANIVNSQYVEIRPLQSKLNSSRRAHNSISNEEFVFNFQNFNYCVMPQKSYE